MLTAVPISKYLAEVPLARLPGEPSARQIRPPKLQEVRPDPDYSAEIERAYRRGLEEGRTLARAEHATQLDEMRQAMEAQRLADRHTWSQEEAARLADALEAGMAQITEQISGSVARILSPFLLEERRRQAVRELAKAINTMVQRPREVELVLNGPEDLIDALVDQLGGRFRVKLETADATDVTVTIEDTIIETRIGAWLASIAEGARVG